VAKYKKTVLMPVGIDTDKFSIYNSQFSNKKNKILFLGRMDTIKRPDLLVDALAILNKKNVDFVCDFYGDSTPEREDYYNSIKKEVGESNLKEKVNFYKGVPNYETPKIYNEHSIYVNLTPAGSFDKTILEAASCGCLLVIANKSLSGEIDERMIAESNPEDVASKIDFWLSAKESEKEGACQKIADYVIKKHSLKALTEKLYEQIFR
jgi:glycosyltransferase involved in cell wall biosynthesis